MNENRVAAYQMMWHVERGEGVVKLRFQDERETHFKVSSLPDLAAFGDILRNEYPFDYDAERGILSSGWEPIGEQER